MFIYLYYIYKGALFGWWSLEMHRKFGPKIEDKKVWMIIQYNYKININHIYNIKRLYKPI